MLPYSCQRNKKPGICRGKMAQNIHLASCKQSQNLPHLKDSELRDSSSRTAFVISPEYKRMQITCDLWNQENSNNNSSPSNYN